MYCECLPFFNYLTCFVTTKSENLKKTFILVNIKKDSVYVDSFLLQIFLYNFISLLDKMIRTFNVLNAFYYWSLVTKCEKRVLFMVKARENGGLFIFTLFLRLRQLAPLFLLLLWIPSFCFMPKTSSLLFR